MPPAATDRQGPAAAVVLLILGPSAASPRSLDALVAEFPAASQWSAIGALRAVQMPFDTAAHEEGALARLAPSEAAHAAQMRDERARQAYVTVHACLRSWLARELGAGATSLEFDTGTFGKPCLRGARPPLHFSVSRRPGFAAIALGRAPLGVDVEAVRDGVDAVGIAQRFFTAGEQAWVEAGGAQAARRFFSLWSRKEALLKAAGLGVDHLPSADALKSSAALVNESGAPRSYAVHQLESPADCSLAVAIEMPPVSPT